MSPLYFCPDVKAQPVTRRPGRFNAAVMLCLDLYILVVILKCVLQHTVEVLSLLSDDVETDDAGPGENLKLRLKGIEEEEILPGFILCSPDNLCHSGRTFDAQVTTADEPRRCRFRS